MRISDWSSDVCSSDLVLKGSDIVPVIAPIGIDDKGQTFNINADTVAGAIAGAVGATRLLLLTDVAGVLDKQGRLTPEMTNAEARDYMRDGTLKGGMIPQVETFIAALETGPTAALLPTSR